MAHAQSLPQIKTFCFKKEECEKPPYRGEARETTECSNPQLQDQRYIQAGYIYHCYAQPKAIPLQVSIGGREVPGIEEYISRLYIYLVSVAGIVVGIMYVWAGVKWLTSAGTPDKITDAKKKIGNATVGLVLVLSSYLILQTVNPALTRLRLPALKMPRQVRLGDDPCVNREAYPCGGLHLKTPLTQDSFGQWAVRWDDAAGLLRDGNYGCDDAQNPRLVENPPCQQGVGAGSCVPRFCPFQGCYTLLQDRITEKAEEKLLWLSRRRLGDRPISLLGFQNAGVPVRPGVDAQIVTNEFYDFRESVEKGQKMCVKPEQCGGCAPNTPWAVCISSACPCVLDVKKIGAEEKIVCAPRQSPGQACSAHEQCASRRCNFGRGGLGGECTPPGGELPGQPCDQDADCASGLCNENWAEDVCVAAGSLRLGQDCSASTECASGICGYEGVVGGIFNPAWDPVCVAEPVSGGPLGTLAPCEAAIVGCNTRSGD